jgi:CBS domain-containing protein
MTAIESMVKKPVVTASLGECVDVVSQRMVSEGVGAVVVVDGEKVAGVFSERDLLVRVVSKGLIPSDTIVGDVATREVVSVSKDESLRVCAGLLKAHRVRHLPIVENGLPVGMVSARDFFESVANDLEDLIGKLRYGEQLSEGQDPYDHVGGSYGR